MNSTYKDLSTAEKIYLASDFHLGVPSPERSLERERKIVRWLESVRKDARAIMLVGDIFDFWFEYKHVIPKGFIRFQGKIAELVDDGIEIIFYTGNHDMWMFEYFSEELGIPVIREPESYEIGQMKIMIGHGDGLGPGDRTYKYLKRVFSSPILQWAFGWIHPNLGIAIANSWSKKSRISNEKYEEKFLGEAEWLLQYCKQVEAQEHHDYYIFGHRHLPLELEVSPKSMYLNLGEWFNHFTYAEIDQSSARLCRFED